MSAERRLLYPCICILVEVTPENVDQVLEAKEVHERRSQKSKAVTELRCWCFQIPMSQLDVVIGS